MVTKYYGKYWDTHFWIIITHTTSNSKLWYSFIGYCAIHFSRVWMNGNYPAISIIHYMLFLITAIIFFFFLCCFVYVAVAVVPGIKVCFKDDISLPSLIFMSYFVEWRRDKYLRCNSQHHPKLRKQRDKLDQYYYSSYTNLLQHFIALWFWTDTGLFFFVFSGIRIIFSRQNYYENKLLTTMLLDLHQHSLILWFLCWYFPRIRIF